MDCEAYYSFLCLLCCIICETIPFLFFLTFYFVLLTTVIINNVVIVSGTQERDSVMHIRVSILPNSPPIQAAI